MPTDSSEEGDATVDTTPDPDAASGSGTDEQRGGGRDVEVPLRLYKTVTVFSTLFAVAFVLGGFVVLDAATDRARAPPSEIDPVLAVLGVGGIALGAAVYAFSTRFRATGMGKPNTDGDEPSRDD